ncbi:unnamed protein product [Cyprideis torosa]|uniref:Uncharacterized protein n=1 Tax=Cyprideis torosa TaxID=163714 RepID=A0A7R8WY21_9CRUS|nr:unnamed protein product [Cyprideis torosa]CAG0909075.1 unnamed protein product [Cyprideis torosa]
MRKKLSGVLLDSKLRLSLHGHWRRLWLSCDMILNL